MNVLGLIVEYNPLHNGHVYHFQEAKKLAQADAVIAIMSGNFLQRGEPAIVSKWARTEMALHLGVDLVIELPIAYAAQPAEWFAYGAVQLLHATQLVTHLCFGSEAGSLQLLQALAEQLADEGSELQSALSEQLAAGVSYPAAYAAAAAHVCAGSGIAGAAEARALLMQPNNSLGLHYVMALRRLKSGIVPLTLQRLGAGYSDAAPTDARIASATAVRNVIASSGLSAAAPYVPAYTADIMARELAQGRGPMTWESFAQPLFHRLLVCTPEELASHHEMTEGLQHRIKKMLPRLQQPTVEQLLKQLKTKRYTHTKLQRMLLHVLLHHDKSICSKPSLSQGPEYFRVLGFNSLGRQLLKQMKSTAHLPIITRIAELNHPHLEMDKNASAIYANAMPTRTIFDIMRDYRQPPLTI